jgi:DNA polymerase III sliding clamp (beta) subunit (PCNA family)
MSAGKFCYTFYMILSEFQPSTIDINFSDLKKAASEIFEFFATDPFLNSTLYYENYDKNKINNYIYFNYINTEKLYIWITDGFRALLYAINCTSNNKSINFRIKKDDLKNLVSSNDYPASQIILQKNTFEFNSNNKEIFQCGYEAGNKEFDYIINPPVINEVSVNGNILKQQAALFGTNEIFELIPDIESSKLIFRRSITHEETRIPCESRGKTITRFVNPIFIYPFLLYLKNRNNIIIRFKNPYLIEMSEKDLPNISYVLMPIRKEP